MFKEKLPQTPCKDRRRFALHAASPAKEQSTTELVGERRVSGLNRKWVDFRFSTTLTNQTMRNRAALLHPWRFLRWRQWYTWIFDKQIWAKMPAETSTAVRLQRHGLSGRTPIHSSNAEGQHKMWMFPVFGCSSLALWISSNSVYAEDVRTKSFTRPTSAANSDMQNPSLSLESSYAVEAKSNRHTAKWRVFTDMARNFFSQGKFDEAESFFCQALEEAKKGFGERDPHVASAHNNLAEFFRVKKDYEKAEPLYLEAVKILEQSMGAEHESVGFALHNLAGFYLLQNKLDLSRDCYERSLKIKGRMLGTHHPEYANTMFHLGEVFRLQGNLNDAIALIKNSLQILEISGLDQSTMAIKRMSRLAQILAHSSLLQEAEALQRKVVHALELFQDSKPTSLVFAMEALAKTLEELEKFDECEKLLQRCLDMRKKILKPKDMQICACLFKLAMVTLHWGDKLAITDKAKAMAEYEKAKTWLLQTTRMAEQNWKDLMSSNITTDAVRPNINGKVDVVPLLTCHFLALVCSLNTLGLLCIRKIELNANFETSEKEIKDAEEALRRALFLFKEQQANKVIASSLQLKREYLNCLQYLAKLLGSDSSVNRKCEEEVQSLLFEASALKSELL